MGTGEPSGMQADLNLIRVCSSVVDWTGTVLITEDDQERQVSDIVQFLTDCV